MKLLETLKIIRVKSSGKYLDFQSGCPYEVDKPSEARNWQGNEYHLKLSFEGFNIEAQDWEVVQLEIYETIPPFHP